MTGEILDLIQRPFGEVVDDLLTAVVGGVVNEPLQFDEKLNRYPLAEPSRGIRGVTGQFGVPPAHTQFQLEVDFSFSEADNALIWRDEGRKPTDNTIFYIDYFRRFSESPLTDINVGSVTRTLTEAIAREVFLLYQEVNQAYLSAFIDTATGKSLELVVSILNVQRKTKEYAEGLATFFRDPDAADGNITIPEGTLLSTAKGEATFVSTQLRTLQRGQSRIDVPVRSTEASKGPTGVVAAGLINTLVFPITGVARVTNFDETILGENDETDEELRARAKAVAQSLGQATLAAIKRVIAEERATLIDVFEPNIEGKTSDPGTVAALVNVTPGRFLSLRAAVEDVRAAGVRVTLVVKQVMLKPRLQVSLNTLGITAQGRLKVRNEIVDAIGIYLESLDAGAPATGTGMLAAIARVQEVKTAKIKDVIVRVTDLNRLPSGALLPARDLIRNVSGGPRRRFGLRCRSSHVPDIHVGRPIQGMVFLTGYGSRRRHHYRRGGLSTGMPSKTDRILSYLPFTFLASRRQSALRAIAGSVGNELQNAEIGLARIMRSHWVDSADEGSLLIDDLEKIASMYGSAPLRDLTGEQLETVEQFRRRLKRHVRTLLQGRVTVRGLLNVAAQILDVTIPEGDDLDVWWKRRERETVTIQPRGEDAAALIFGREAIDVRGTDAEPAIVRERSI